MGKSNQAQLVKLAQKQRNLSAQSKIHWKCKNAIFFLFKIYFRHFFDILLMNRKRMSVCVVPLPAAVHWGPEGRNK